MLRPRNAEGMTFGDSAHYLQVKLCDPCLSALSVPPWPKKCYINTVPFLPFLSFQSAQAWITQFYLQITPCLPFLRGRSPDVTTTATEAADIQLQLTTHLWTRKDERLSWPSWLTYSGWFTHISGHPSATGRAQDSESTMLYRWTTQPTVSPKIGCYGNVSQHLWTPIKHMIPTTHRSPQPKRHPYRFSRSAVFAQMTVDCVECQYTLQWDAHSPPKICPFPWGIWTPI